MVSEARKKIIFNRVLTEFLSEYKTIKNIKLNVPKVSIEDIVKFNTEVKNCEEKFIKCDPECILNISLCKKIELDVLNLQKNPEIIWKYLHNLYFVSNEKKDTIKLIEESKDNIKALEKTVQPMTSLDFGGLSSVIQEVSKVVASQLEGKDLSNVDPSNMFDMLSNGSSGIDFASIIKNTTEQLNLKISSGELDVNSLTNQLKPFMNQQ